MDLLDLIKKRRSIRKYQDKQISREDLEKIIEAGLYAPNAGGRQRTIIVGVHNKELTEAIGRVNITYEDRRHMGIQVSKEQPSILDDPTIENAFYGAPTGTHTC
jgi:nitroreductase